MGKTNPVVVAVTGGMGTGQTTVCKLLEKMGAKIINADLVAKQEVDNNDFVKRELKNAFGSKIFFRNGKLNRKMLAGIAFSDEAKTQRLNKIVHPQMVSRILDLVEEARDSGKYDLIAIDAALIYELSLEHMFDAVVVVASHLKKRIERVSARDRLSAQEITDRIDKQIPIKDKIKWGDYVIHNNGTEAALEQKVQKVYQQLLKQRKGSRRTAG
ncbi:MAG: dephospho-CoA kinase [Calditrichia bacterium]